jgi:prolyl oligopeptidase
MASTRPRRASRFPACSRPAAAGTPIAVLLALIALALTIADPAPATAARPATKSRSPKRATRPVPATPEPADPELIYPLSPAEATADTLHGVVVPDPYRWLENAGSPDVQRWMEAEDSVARAFLDKLPERAAIADRLRSLYYVDNVSPPLHRGDRYFYSRRLPDKEKAIVYWRESATGSDSVLLDPNTWSDAGNLSLGEWVVSWDGRRVAYKVSKNNADDATLYVMDVATGKRSDIDVITGARYATPSWTPKGDGFYYTWLPMDTTIAEAARPGYAEVRFHKLGDDPTKDRVIRQRTGDPAVFESATMSRDGHWLFLQVDHGWSSTDLYFRKGKARDSEPFRPLTVGGNAHYFLREYRDRFYISTDEGAPRSRIFRVDPKHPERARWVEVAPERADATLGEFTIAGESLVMTYLKDAASLLEIRALDGSNPRDVALPSIGSVKYITGMDDEDDAYFSFQSFTTPPEVHEFSVAAATQKLWSRPRMPIDPEVYDVEEVFYTSRDGTRVPMFLVHRKDFPRDGTGRALLTGYGGFLVGMTPYFSRGGLVWADHGGVFAVACLRGGNEYGEAWHRAGMLLQKQNVFDDFIAGAEYLVQQRWTRPHRLSISGGSNGGLLVGVALTQKPSLFGAVVCAVPLLDMIRYDRFGAGATWTSEYGSAQDSAQFRALYAYSPYHHVEDGVKYPPVLFLSADSDDRVDPMHARKMAAALQNASAGGPVLLRIEKNAGHGGADLIRSYVEQGADTYSFLLQETAAGPP